MANPIGPQIDDVPDFHFSQANREKLKKAQNCTVDAVTNNTKPMLETSISGLGVPTHLTQEIVDRSVYQVGALAKGNADSSIDALEGSITKTNGYFSQCVIS